VLDSIITLFIRSQHNGDALPKNWLIIVEEGKGQNRPWVLETSIHEGVKKGGGRSVCFKFLSVFSPKK